jgi:hypothetical protein
VKLGGSPIVEITAEEAFALQYYLLDYNPFYYLPSADNGAGFLNSVIIPLNHPARPKGQLQAQLLYSGHTTVDTERITLIHRFGPQTRPELAGIAGYLSMLRTSKTPSQTGWSDSATISLPTRGLLHGFLAYLTTVPGGTTAVTSSSILEGKITVGGADWDIFNVVTARPDVDFMSEATYQAAVLDNYIFRKYSPPLDLSAAVVKFEWYAGTADAVNFVPIVELPP